MRINLTIDDQIATALKKQADETGTTFNTVVNGTLALGLTVGHDPESQKIRFKTPTYDLGEPTYNVTKANAIAGELEDEVTIDKLRI